MMGKYHLQELLVLKKGDGHQIAGIIQAESILNFIANKNKKIMPMSRRAKQRGSW